MAGFRLTGLLLIVLFLPKFAAGQSFLDTLNDYYYHYYNEFVAPPPPPTPNIATDVTNPPFGCLNYAYCYPGDRTMLSNGTITCSNCICANTTTGGNCTNIADACTPNPCSAPTTNCINNIGRSQCECPAGYSGTNCNQQTGTMCATSPCLNGGTCVQNASDPNSYQCTCRRNYGGTNCQFTNPCSPNPCNNSATCNALPDYSNYTCACPAVWEGQNCDQPVNIFGPATQMGCVVGTSALQQIGVTSINLGNENSPQTCEAEMTTNTAYQYFALSGQTCYLSTSPWSGLSQTCSGSNNCPGNGSTNCGVSGSVSIVYSANFTQSLPFFCNASYCQNGGQCINTPSNAQCACPEGFTGAMCETPVDPCNPSPCGQDAVCVNATSGGGGYMCQCGPGYSGPYCNETEICTPTTCLYGGICSVVAKNRTSTAKCACLNIYTGPTCETFNACYNSPCTVGTCSVNGTGLNTTYACTCPAGYTDQNCSTVINYCDPSPCMYNATCSSYIGYYNCSCPTGSYGKNCSNLVNNCYHGLCNSVDVNATCTNGLNTYTCNCTSQWMGQTCTMPYAIWFILQSIGATDNSNAESLIWSMLSSPSMIADMVPYILGLMSEQDRIAMSWQPNEFFLWAAYEQKQIDYTTQMVLSNDVSLGNCFTFNGNSTLGLQMARVQGNMGAFEALLNLDQNEYLLWVDYAAILIFVHDADMPVLTDSVRYNAPPLAITGIDIAPAEFTRLGGEYGRCITSTSQVKSYYYSGPYTTDGCLSACYQDGVEGSCGCYDPRYPYPSDGTACTLTMRNCVNNFTAVFGDPSTWESCICPLPCSNNQYSITVSMANDVFNNAGCQAMSNKTAAAQCRANQTNYVQIRVQLPTLTYQVYRETPTMDLNKFIAYLGGLVGVLNGVALVSVVELLYLTVRLLMILFCNK